MCPLPCFVSHFSFRFRCEALPDHLDEAGARLRMKTKTETLIRCFDPGILWDEYGVRSDVVVCSFFPSKRCLILCPQPFTAGFPRADIHELLSCNLLHQVIKGMFKDHIVTWVNEYLHLTHGEKRALEIIQDIDRRYLWPLLVILLLFISWP